MNCDHITKVLDWQVEVIDGDVKQKPSLYGCLNCDETFNEIPKQEETLSDHSNHIGYVDGCFACKIRTIELNAGDASRAESMPQKKWDAELDAYREARAQGIQPAGTTMKAINEAKAASDTLGTAYNAETMPAATKITKQVASVGKETGTI